MEENRILKKSSLHAKTLFEKYNIFLILIVLIIVSTIISNNFLSWRNISNILKQVSALGVISLGMHFIIMTGGIDLSVGAVTAMTNVLFAYLMINKSMPFGIAFVMTIIVGAIVGAVIGYFVAYRKIVPFVVTLAFTTIAQGIAYIISNGAPIMVQNDAVNNLTRGTILGLPVCAVVLFAVFIIGALVMKYSVFGRMTVAIGSNEEAAVLCGVKTKLFKMGVYIMTGLLCGLAGIITASRTGCGSPLVGDGYELDAIAAVVIGGGSLNGGKGIVINTLCGLFVLQIITNIMNLMNIPTYPQQVIKGVIIIVAVLVQRKEDSK